MTSHHVEQNGDAVTVILTFAIIAFMFVGLLMEKIGNGEFVDC
jgi:hypothetical protein